MSRSRTRLMVGTGLGLALVATVLALLGSMRSMQVATVSRSTTATAEAVWELWADVPQRTRWDEGLEWIRSDGPFGQGTTGTVKLKGQPQRHFEVIEANRPTEYTDRFFLPAGTRMDWRHRIEQRPDGHYVTFTVRVQGPTALLLTPILRSILGEELPGTVDRLVTMAEAKN